MDFRRRERLTGGMMAGGSSKVSPLRALRPCPECGSVSLREFYPFCSARCKNIDLNRWLSGAYAIPVLPDEDGGDGSPESDV